jgi:predicted RNA-binding protein YlxR (DUF448 family)
MTVPSTDSELDSGPRGRERERLCVATRTVRPVSDLIRFVVSPDGEAVPDLKCKLPGRGVWVTATQAVLDEAIKRNVFARGFKRNVRVAADLLVRTERLLEQSVLDALAIAGKAGLVAAGFTKVEVALSHERVATILHAAEASADGVKKLDAARRRSQGGPVPVIEVLTSAQLDLALGRSNVIHAALLAGAPSDTLLARLRRLERYRTGDLGQNGPGRAGRADPGEPAATVGGYGTG